MKIFHFGNDLSDVDKDCFLVSIGQKVGTKNELLEILNDKFRFPYFGFNWDALWDVLNDLSWIEQRKILLIHEITPRLSYKDMSIYVNLLFDLINNWKEGEIHSLDVFFPKEDMEYVMQNINR